MIGGSVVIAIVTVILVCALLYYRHRRKQKQWRISIITGQGEVAEHLHHSEYTIEPFIIERRPTIHQPSFDTGAPSHDSGTQYDPSSQSQSKDSLSK